MSADQLGEPLRRLLPGGCAPPRAGALANLVDWSGSSARSTTRRPAYKTSYGLVLEIAGGATFMLSGGYSSSSRAVRRRRSRLWLSLPDRPGAPSSAASTQPSARSAQPLAPARHPGLPDKLAARRQRRLPVLPCRRHRRRRAPGASIDALSPGSGTGGCCAACTATPPTPSCVLMLAHLAREWPVRPLAGFRRFLADRHGRCCCSPSSARSAASGSTGTNSASTGHRHREWLDWLPLFATR